MANWASEMGDDVEGGVVEEGWGSRRVAAYLRERCISRDRVRQELEYSQSRSDHFRKVRGDEWSDDFGRGERSALAKLLDPNASQMVIKALEADAADPYEHWTFTRLLLGADND